MPKHQQAAIVLCLLAFASAQTVSLTAVLKQQQKQLPENCLKADDTGNCLQCRKDFQVSKGFCVSVPVKINLSTNEEEPQSPPQDFIPCEGRSSCGESLTFGGTAQLSDFLNNYAGNSGQILADQSVIRAKTIQTTTTTTIPMADAAFSSGAASGAAKIDFSGTNNQVGNVDEADLLKTDGTYIYTISGNQLSIVRAYPVTRAAVLSTIDLKGFNPTAIFIEGDYLAVFGTSYQFYNYCSPTLIRPTFAKASIRYQPINPCYDFTNPSTKVRIYSVKNRSSPTLIKNFEIDGSYFNGRKTDKGWIYILAKQYVYRRNNPFPWYSLGSQRVSIDSSSLFYFPSLYQTPVFVNIFAFSLRHPYAIGNSNAISVVTEDAQQLYMSEGAIYISYARYINSKTYTNIHKIYINKERIIPFADGRVEGEVNNQFWMDEYGSFLRVAAIVRNSKGVSNSVYCLDYFLDVYGQIGNIAPNETIHSARFVDRRLYLVTFRRVDPFFVIGFASHRHPKILGELKITGFSTYLHPYDEDTIIGLGRQATVNGQQLGLKISLFDVTNVLNPKETTNFELEQKYASSGAEWEHKAFLFSKDRNLLVIPGSYYSTDLKFNGAFVFNIQKTSIALTAIVDHLQSQDDTFYLRTVERDLYIENFLYSKSKCLISIFDLNNYDRYPDISIPCQDTPTRLPIVPLEDQVFIPLPRIRPLPADAA